MKAIKYSSNFRMLWGSWDRSSPCPCRSPVGQTPAFTLCVTLPTLTCSAGTTSPRLLQTFCLMLWIIIWGQNRSGESELFCQVRNIKVLLDCHCFLFRCIFTWGCSGCWSFVIFIYSSSMGCVYTTIFPLIILMWTWPFFLDQPLAVFLY